MSTRARWGWVAAGPAVGAVLGVLATRPSAQVAVAVAVLAAVVLLARPEWALLTAAASLPFVLSVRLGGQQVAASDLALAAALLGVALWQRRSGTDAGRSPAATAVWLAIGGYTAVGAVQAVALHEGFSLVLVFYRAVMLGLPFAAGLAFGLRTALIRRALTAYVALTCVIAAGWCLEFGTAAFWGINKNPGAQMMVNALIVLMVQARLRLRDAGAGLVLAAGVLATGSRGALLGLGVALLCLILARYSSAWTWRRALVLIGVSLAVLAIAPASTTDRILAEDASGLYNLDIRGVFVADALSQAADDMAVGHGEGTYRPVDPALSRVVSLDPHNVWALQLFEGGIPLLLVFIVLGAVPIVLMWRRRVDPLCLAALAAEASVLVHSSVDIYWVRATPTFAFLLLGVGLARSRCRDRDRRPDTESVVAEPLSLVRVS